eukprot:5029559-Amphidinium_carterae.2
MSWIGTQADACKAHLIQQRGMLRIALPRHASRRRSMQPLVICTTSVTTAALATTSLGGLCIHRPKVGQCRLSYQLWLVISKMHLPHTAVVERLLCACVHTTSSTTTDHPIRH